MSVYTAYDEIYLMRKSKKDFVNHKHRAKNRGVSFLLSFDEWIKIWNESGHLSERGRGAGRFVMSRFNDIGPYSIDNVAIISQEENLSQGHKGKKHKRIKSKPKILPNFTEFSLSKDRNL
jgi:hypothetical protein